MAILTGVQSHFRFLWNDRPGLMLEKRARGRRIE